MKNNPFDSAERASRLSSEGFSEEVLRARLHQSLEGIEVSEALKRRTLDACAAWLGSNGLVGEAMDPLSDQTEETEASETHGVPDVRQAEGGWHRLLPFTGRHAVFFRVAGGLAACLILVFMLIDVLPGNRAANTAGMMAASSMAAGAEAPAARGNGLDGFSMIDQAPGARAEKQAEDAGEAQDAETSMEASAMVTFSEPVPAPREGEKGEDGTVAVESVLAGDASYGAALTYTGVPGNWQSRGQTQLTGALPVKPSESMIRNALDTQSAALEEMIGQTPIVDPGSLLAVLRLEQPLDAETLDRAQGLRDLVAIDPAGKNASLPIGEWVIPLTGPAGQALVALREEPAGTKKSEWKAEEPLPIQAAWLGLLSSRADLLASLEYACGGTVTDFILVDIQEGRGFWVGWQAEGMDWVMPLMTSPEWLGLENERAYSWEALVAIVGPHL